jgi:predicted acyltransferase
VFITTGLDLVIISFLLYILEINKWNKGNWTNFFTIMGKNPLFLYITSEILVIILYMIPVSPTVNFYGWINTVFYQEIAPGAVGSLLFAISFMLLCWLVGYVLDKRKIYIRV